MSGRFITLEGGEGVGKSTQARRLAAALSERGRDVVLTREPGGTPGAEAIRALLLTGDGDRWSARTEAVLFAAARADHVERVIRPALARGAWVICDRFIDSTRAYQGGAGNVSDGDILALHAIASAGLMPDRTLLMTLDPAQAQARANVRDGHAGDRIGSRGSAYHSRLNSAFLEIAAREPDRVKIVAADGDEDDVHRALFGAIVDLT